jgi:hypothetical protein
MVIQFNTILNANISVSIDGREYSDEAVELPKGQRTGTNANPLLQKVSEYQDKGWELMNFNALVGGMGNSEVHLAYLRKKKD